MDMSQHGPEKADVTEFLQNSPGGEDVGQMPEEFQGWLCTWPTCRPQVQGCLGVCVGNLQLAESRRGLPGRATQGPQQEATFWSQDFRK